MKSYCSCHSFKIQGCDKVHCSNHVTMFVQPCHHLVTTLRQFQNTRLCQGCAKVVKKYCGNLVPRLCQGCDNLVISIWAGIQTTGQELRQQGRNPENRAGTQTTGQGLRQQDRNSDNRAGTQTTGQGLRQQGRKSDNRAWTQTTQMYIMFKQPIILPLYCLDSFIAR